MNDEQSKQYSQIVAKCWADAAFKARLMADPQTVLAAEGVEVPAGIGLRVVENSANVLYLVLPPKPEESELSDEALGEIAGGYSCDFCGSA